MSGGRRWRELEPAMGPSRRRQGERGLCAWARPAALCAKRARCFGEEGCPGARAHARVVGGAETTHRNAELQDGLESRRHGCQPQRYGCDAGAKTRDAFIVSSYTKRNVSLSSERNISVMKLQYVCLLHRSTLTSSLTVASMNCTHLRGGSQSPSRAQRAVRRACRRSRAGAASSRRRSSSKASSRLQRWPSQLQL